MKFLKQWLHIILLILMNLTQQQIINIPLQHILIIISHISLSLKPTGNPSIIIGIIKYFVKGIFSLDELWSFCIFLFVGDNLVEGMCW